MDIQLEALRSRAMVGVRFAAAALVGLLVADCEAFGIRPGGDGPVVLPSFGVPCVGQSSPDPGWRPVDCRIADRIKKLQLITFDSANNPDFESSAENLYVYADGTAHRRFEYQGVFQNTEKGWQPPTSQVGPICAPSTCPENSKDECDAKNAVLHLVGGPFTGWGGGIGLSMQKLNGVVIGDPAVKDIEGDSKLARCMTDPPAPECPPADAEYAVRVAALDVSQYDGVSFWARRGPDSQMGIRINVGDKYTDDDLSYLANRYNSLHPDEPEQPLHCQRVRECACRNQKKCVLRSRPKYFASNAGPDKGYYCGVESDEERESNVQSGDTVETACGVEPATSLLDPSAGLVDLSGGGSTAYCNTTMCERPYPAFSNDLPDGGIGNNDEGIDVQFHGRPCTQYAFPSGIGSSYCFDPKKDPPPAPTTEICGDHWMKTVTLSTEWQFYKIPFNDLRQQGFAKKSAQIDLHSVSVVRFTWDVGWIDYWIDDLSFYRNTD